MSAIRGRRRAVARHRLIRDLLVAIVATAAITAGLTVVAPHAGASSSGRGRANEKPCLDLHSYLTVASKKVGCVPFGTMIAIQCTDAGDKVQGPYGGSMIWDVTTYRGQTGYVADAWVFTGTSNPVAPACAGKGKGRIANSPCLHLRGDTSETAPALDCVADGTVVTIACTKQGDAVVGPWATSKVWDRTTWDGQTGYMPDAWIYTATSKPVARSC